MDSNIATSLLQATIIAVVGPVVLLVLGRIFNKKTSDTDLVAKLQKLYNDAIDALNKERKTNAEVQEALRTKVNALEERQATLEQATFGPFLITLEVDSRPLQITSSKIELAPIKK